jgi:hypothetical protein
MMLLGYICQQAVRGFVQVSLILRDDKQILAPLRHNRFGDLGLRPQCVHRDQTTTHITHRQ